ncbi:hypothetical protein HARCEL1_05075 [Halococcoides cellulosivorans]|uniref:PGF-CTERM sorting domain-containing protein n=2 Tax=Halococcoides cellulosivorans TaxID=1679096 RepID=A0A2R4X017_9EURY|nr:hypothetical protein HARCEL1_05075 [Halococcoides cellulosivorans]
MVPALLATVALLAVVAPAVGAGVTIADQTVNPGGTVELTPEIGDAAALEIEDVPGDWDVSVDGSREGNVYDAGDTQVLRLFHPSTDVSISFTVPESASGTHELTVQSFYGDDGEETTTFTITVAPEADDANADSGDESGGAGGLANDQVDIETTTTDASTDSQTSAESDDPADETTTDDTSAESDDPADETTTDASTIDTDTPTPVPVTTEDGPGFGVVAAFLAIAALVARRR